jgi:hypothetical protein
MADAKKPRAFVLISFEDQYLAVYEELIKAPLEDAGYEVERADSRLNQQSILKDIIRGIAGADLVVADLTGLNPNVFYELGIAHSLGVATILMTQNLEELPFDLRAYRANEYATHFSEAPKIRDKIKEIGESRIKGLISFGSPVTDFLPRGFEPRLPAAPALAVPDREDATDPEEPEPRGVLDFLLESDEAGDEFAKAMDRITAATEAVGVSVQAHTQEITELSASPGPNTVKLYGAVASRIADDLNGYADALEKELPAAERGATFMLEGGSAYAEWIRLNPTEVAGDQLAEFRSANEGLRETARENLEIIRDFRETLAGLRGFSRPVTSASSRVVRALDRLIALTENVESQSARILSLTADPDAPSMLHAVEPEGPTGDAAPPVRKVPPARRKSKPRKRKR